MLANKKISFQQTIFRLNKEIWVYPPPNMGKNLDIISENRMNL